MQLLGRILHNKVKCKLKSQRNAGILTREPKLAIWLIKSCCHFTDITYY